MLELLAETSQLAAASLLRTPLGSEHHDPVLEWREAFQVAVAPEEPHLLKAVAFSQLQAITNRYFPVSAPEELRLHGVTDVLWLRGAGALYDGQTGLVVPGSYLSRFPRQRQSPLCSTHRIDLTRPIQAFPRLERALVLPYACCNNFGHFITETLAFLWPLLGRDIDQLVGWPALLNGCSTGESAAKALHGLLRERHLFPLLEADLPEAVHIQEALLPEPSLRLHASWSEEHLRTATALGQWLIANEDWDSQQPSGGEKLFISRSALGAETRQVDQEAALEALLQQQGWTIFHPEQHPLAKQINTYRQARVIAAFEGSALHGLSFLGRPTAAPLLLLLGDNPSPDYFLQFRAQRIPGFFIQCTRHDPNSEQPDWVRRRLLNGSIEGLASMVETLASQ